MLNPASNADAAAFLDSAPRTPLSTPPSTPPPTRLTSAPEPPRKVAKRCRSESDALDSCDQVAEQVVEQAIKRFRVNKDINQISDVMCRIELGSPVPSAPPASHLTKDNDFNYDADSDDSDSESSNQEEKEDNNVKRMLDFDSIEEVSPPPVITDKIFDSTRDLITPRAFRPKQFGVIPETPSSPRSLRHWSDSPMSVDNIFTEGAWECAKDSITVLVPDHFVAEQLVPVRLPQQIY